MIPGEAVNVAEMLAYRVRRGNAYGLRRASLPAGSMSAVRRAGLGVRPGRTIFAPFRKLSFCGSNSGGARLAGQAPPAEQPKEDLP